MAKNQTVYEINDLKLYNESLLLNETLFHNANGYIGIRSVFEEGYPDGFESVRGQYINGVYDLTKISRAEQLYGLIKEKQTLVNVIDTQTIKLNIGNESFSMFEGTVLASKRWVDTAKGITGRYVKWRSPSGKELELNIKRMTSFYQLTLFTIEYELTPLNFSEMITLESHHDANVRNYVNPDDPRIAANDHQYMIPLSCEIQNGISFITSTTSKSDIQICTCVRNVLSQEADRLFFIDNNNAICQLTTPAVKGEKITLIKYVVFCDSIRCTHARDQAGIEIDYALSIPLEEYYAKQEEYLKEYWENCYVEIDGDDEINMALRYNLYQLIQSVGKDQYCNISPKGLSGEGYEGHYFWDTEMYSQPFFTITNPAISKKLIEFRYETLDMAKEHARILGHKRGALYPWRTIMGRECSGYYPSGSAQYHINGDIAYSIIAYYLATKDIAFIQEKGAEIVFETARLWLDVGNYHKGKFHINGITGPDEYTCIVNNNYYTNLIAQYHLRWAVIFYEILKVTGQFRKVTNKIGLTESEIAAFKLASDSMYLPYDPELKINPQDDSFLQKKKLSLDSVYRKDSPMFMRYHPLFIYRHQICKQADTIMAYLILEDAQSEETMLNSFNYYEKITTHDSSLSKCIFSIMAARLGMDEKAFEYFGKSALLDLQDLFHNTRDGIHTANMAGSYMSIVYGFGGFRLKESGIWFSPILPEKWNSYSFHIRYENSRIGVSVNRGENIFTLECGTPKPIYVYGVEYLLKDKLVISQEANRHGWINM
jgi:alpha,alpha-trehalose phosphorylase